jgi:hypothetical protein
MPSMNLCELRNTRQLKAWLKAGKTVELRERNHLLARITPEKEKQRVQPVEWPDFEARAKKIFGNRVLNVVDDLIEERSSRY